MSDKNAFSWSMDEKKNPCPQQSDEVWSELHNSHGKEFDLPNLVNPLSSDASVNDADLVDMSFGLIDIPLGVDDTFLKAISDSSYDGNPMESLHVLEKQKETNPTNGHASADSAVFGSENSLPAQNNSEDILVAPKVSPPGSTDFGSEAASVPITKASNVGPLGLQNSTLTMARPVFIPTPQVTNGQNSGLGPFQDPYASSFSYSEGTSMGFSPFGDQVFDLKALVAQALGQPFASARTQTEGNDFSIQENGKRKKKIPSPQVISSDSEESESPVLKRQKHETLKDGESSSPALVHDVFMQALDALDEIPPPEMLVVKALGLPFGSTGTETGGNDFSNQENGKGKEKESLPSPQVISSDSEESKGPDLKRQKKESFKDGESSSPALVHDVKALDALDEIPPQGMLALEQLIIKEQPESKDPQN